MKKESKKKNLRGSLSRRGNKFQIVILSIIGALIFMPIVFTVIISFKTIPQFSHHPFMITLPLHFENYLAAWGKVKLYIWNSVIVCSVACLGILALAIPSAYVFARFKFPLSRFLFFLFLSLIMIPPVASLVTRFIMVKRLGIINTYWGLIFPYMSGGQVIAIFILRSFFASIPQELFDAGIIDGASEFTLLRRVVLPLSKPMIWTMAILNVVSNWNNIIWPLITLSKPKLYPVTVGLLFFRNQFATNEGPLMAGYVISSIPLIILFCFASRSFIRGIAAGALKG